MQQDVTNLATVRVDISNCKRYSISFLEYEKNDCAPALSNKLIIQKLEPCSYYDLTSPTLSPVIDLNHPDPLRDARHPCLQR